MTETSAKKRVLSGMRPTGRLHIGHFFGALENWVKLQNDPQYECFFFVADWHALTSDYADTSQVAQNSIEIATDFLASGLDPRKSTIFLQSSVPEHAELTLLLSMVTPLGWLERVPTYKEALENVKDKDLHTYGFLGYPVLQTADIVIYGEHGSQLIIPVGEDQVSHVELSREIVRRFNSLYGFRIDPSLFDQGRKYLDAIWDSIFSRPLSVRFIRPIDADGKKELEAELRVASQEMGVKNLLERVENAKLEFDRMPEYFRLEEILTEPEAMLTHTPRIPGTDGRKMSKSYKNFIALNESDTDIRAKTKLMMTDPARKRRTDPGNPEVCPVYDWHRLFSPWETQKWSAAGCRSAGIGCIECKAAMADNLIKWITPIRARREEYAAHPATVLGILDEGATRAREVAQKTMARVREAVFNWPAKRAELGGGAADKLSSGKASG